MALQPDMIGVVVKDMAAALRFYRLLDLPVPDGNDHEPYVECISTNGYRISWNSLAMVRELDPEWEEPTGHRIELAFKCGSPEEVDSVYRMIVAAGHRGRKSPWDAFWGQRYAIVLDPDGNQISLFAPLP